MHENESSDLLLVLRKIADHPRKLGRCEQRFSYLHITCDCEDISSIYLFCWIAYGCVKLKLGWSAFLSKASCNTIPVI